MIYFRAKKNVWWISGQFDNSFSCIRVYIKPSPHHFSVCLFCILRRRRFNFNIGENRSWFFVWKNKDQEKELANQAVVQTKGFCIDANKLWLFWEINSGHMVYYIRIFAHESRFPSVSPSPTAAEGWTDKTDWCHPQLTTASPLHNA